MPHPAPARPVPAAVDIFDRTQKEGLVEQCLKAMTRKFGENADVSVAGSQLVQP